MFEAYTYERLLEEVLDGAPEGIDTGAFSMTRSREY